MSWTTRTDNRTRLAAEELAARDVPAVMVTLEGDVLHVTGSDRADSAHVEPVSGAPGMYLVTTATAGDGFQIVWTVYAPAAASIRFDGLAGDDTFINDTALRSVAYGGDGNDALVGGSAADELRGSLGDDIIFGNGGIDALYGGAGADTIRGGAGNDYMSGGAGNDDLYGGDGDDAMYGDDGDDVMQGGDGADSVAGGAGANIVTQDFLLPPPPTTSGSLPTQQDGSSTPKTGGDRTSTEASSDDTQDGLRELMKTLQPSPTIPRSL